MLKAGSLIDEALETNSMARAIEDAMVAQGVLDLDDETPEVAEQRRKTFIAISTGVITHLRAHLEVIVVASKLAAGIPNAQVKLTGTSEIQ